MFSGFQSNSFQTGFQIRRFSEPPAQDGARPIILSGFGGASTKEDRIALIRAMDELDIPVIANFLIQFIYKNYLVDDVKNRRR